MAATWVNPPAILTALRTQLVACAAWTPGEGAVNYPEIASPLGVTFPQAILVVRAPRFIPFCDAGVPLSGGQLDIIIQATGTVGELEDLASTVMYQLLAQTIIIPFRPSDCGISSDPAPAKVAGLSAYRSIVLNLAYGLEP